MMTPSMLTCCTLLGAVWAASAGTSLLHGNGYQSTQRHSIKVQAPTVEHTLVICNAYASPKPLEILQVRGRASLTQGNPLGYKKCQDFTVPLQEGDQLDFKAGGLDVGTFYATGLPKSPTSLLLIPHRRTAHSVGLSFESHAFAEVKSPQIAVIDAYRGKSSSQSSKVKIIETLPESTEKDAEKAKIEEELNFNSVVAVNPGQYEVSLSGTGGDNATVFPLNAIGASKFVVMRLGVEDESSHVGHYPLELIVYPNTAGHIVLRISISLVAVFAVLFNMRL